MYLLDTSVCMHLLNKKHSQRVSANLQRLQQFFAPLWQVCPSMIAALKNMRKSEQINCSGGNN